MNIPFKTWRYPFVPKLWFWQTKLEMISFTTVEILYLCLGEHEQIESEWWHWLQFGFKWSIWANLLNVPSMVTTEAEKRIVLEAQTCLAKAQNILVEKKKNLCIKIDVLWWWMTDETLGMASDGGCMKGWEGGGRDEELDRGLLAVKDHCV